MEPKMGGFRFTCFRDADAKLSKLDHFLHSPCFLDIASNVTVTTLPRELSDHCPILLSNSRRNFGSPSFKLFSSWMLRDGFEKAFITSWNNFVGFGTPDQYLAAKLKTCQEGLDHEAEKRNLTEVELEQRRDSFKKVAEIDKFKALDIKQKSRIKWAVDGDENTRFFHGYVNSNNRKNGIDGIMINGNWCTDPSLIKMEAFNFFAEKFNERWPSRPKLVSRHFKQILPTDNELLETPFTLQ
ncbi:uncharacterized protein LOC111899176 [Lactuca sativa]|uniref:uncharacterized protein LOC111899176 n=1 Tax=Lactuca sativa TaxID=4236 RepID=UPI000CD92660|nr:uncharacterized protein LOC111899176 [Lactuca sativa]